MTFTLGIDSPHAAAEFAAQIARVELDLLFQRQRGLAVPAYIASAFRQAVQLARARAKR